jgi:hypothetical protein
MERKAFIELLERAIVLYIDCEDYTDKERVYFQKHLRITELAMFIPTEFTELDLATLGITNG